MGRHEIGTSPKVMNSPWNLDVMQAVRHDRNKEHDVAPLDNPRHEKFSQLVASGVKPAEAYVLAGYKKTGASQREPFVNEN